MELNAEQIVKALECCSKGTTEDCAKCPRFDGDRTLSTEDCMEILMRNALALIKQLTEEVAGLKAISEQYQKQFEDCYEEKAKLTDENEAWQKQLITAEEQADKAYYNLACEVEDLRGENARLHASCTEFERKCASLNDENERLKEILHTDIRFVCVSRGSGKTNHLKEVARLRMDEVRAYAVREMHSKIKDRCIKGGIYPAFVARTIDQIAKEMLEGDDA